MNKYIIPFPGNAPAMLQRPLIKSGPSVNSLLRARGYFDGDKNTRRFWKMKKKFVLLGFMACILSNGCSSYSDITVVDTSGQLIEGAIIAGEKAGFDWNPVLYNIFPFFLETNTNGQVKISKRERREGHSFLGKSGYWPMRPFTIEEINAKTEIRKKIILYRYDELQEPPSERDKYYGHSEYAENAGGSFSSHVFIREISSPLIKAPKNEAEMELQSKWADYVKQVALKLSSPEAPIKH